jgi:hypothetical protein
MFEKITNKNWVPEKDEEVTMVEDMKKKKGE